VPNFTRKSTAIEDLIAININDFFDDLVDSRQRRTLEIGAALLESVTQLHGRATFRER